MDTATSLAPHYQGYIDERSTHHVAGWLRNLNAADDRLGYEVVLPESDAEAVLASGIADLPSDVLVQVGVGDGRYAFRAEFRTPLSSEARDLIYVRPVGATYRLELAPGLRTDPPGNGPYQGYLDECSVKHAAGWARDMGDSTRRVSLDILLNGEDGEELLARVVADQFNDLLRQVGVGDGTYSFYVIFNRTLSEADRVRVFVRVTGASHVLESAPELLTRFEPIHYVAMDIVNNCNLRCPFCLYDYSNRHKTEFMTEATFRSAIRLLPYVSKGSMWLSCFHEATLHPRLMEFIEMVPREYRHKIFFTTNLAKRMPREYFVALAQSGISHINISVESLDAPVYETLRKGARFSIFRENWDSLLEVLNDTENPIGLRYVVMAYRSNLNEIPALTDMLLREKRGRQVEIRHTFDGYQIPENFRDEEFLRTGQWAWLEDALRLHDKDRVLLIQPPDGKGFDAAPGEIASPQPPTRGETHDVHCANGQVPRPFMLRIAWDGTLHVYVDKPRNSEEVQDHSNYMITNINNLRDPLAALFSLV